jgi:hypothetical protein
VDVNMFSLKVEISGESADERNVRDKDH